MTPLRVVLFAEEGAVQAAKAVLAAGAALAGVVARGREGERPTPLAALAAQQGVPLWEPSLVRAPGFAGVLADAAPDLLLNVHSLVVIPAEVLAVPRLGAFNLHPGPLPAYAGLSCPSWAILDGCTDYGVTLHWMTPAIDAGPIAYAADVAIGPRDSGLAVSAACIRAGLPLVAALLAQAVADPAGIPRRAQPTPPSRVLPRRLPAAQLALHWPAPAETLDRLCRAADYAPFASPWGTPTARLDERVIGIPRLQPLPEAADAPPGSIIAGDAGAVRVATGDRWVAVPRLALDGRTVLAAEVLAPGDRLFISERIA